MWGNRSGGGGVQGKLIDVISPPGHWIRYGYCTQWVLGGGRVDQLMGGGGDSCWWGI
jgi:hypothetical protein